MYIAIYVLWVVPTLALACLAVAMVRRKIRHQFPFFFAYVVFQLVSFGVEFPVYTFWPRFYYVTYWPITTISIVISFAVIFELFTEIFAPFEGLKDLGGALFRWAAVVLVVAAALIALTTTAPGSIDSRIVISLERSVRVMQCGIVLLMILCAPCVGLRKQHRIFGVAAGFGIIAAVDLLSTAVVARMGVSALTTAVNSLAHLTSFGAAVAMWSVYLLRPEPARAPVVQHAVGERWSFALSTAMHPESAAPSLPLIMGVVDRTFQKLNTTSSRSALGPGRSDQ